MLLNILLVVLDFVYLLLFHNHLFVLMLMFAHSMFLYWDLLLMYNYLFAIVHIMLLLFLVYIFLLHFLFLFRQMLMYTILKMYILLLLHLVMLFHRFCSLRLMFHLLLQMYMLFLGDFLVHFLSFVLRISLNYYHISINEFNSVPHIVSFFGPLVCQYQYWVVGLYMVLSFFVLPLNRDGFWMSVVLGSGLLAFLMMYGTDSLLQNLTNGIVIALMLLTVLPFLWKK